MPLGLRQALQLMLAEVAEVEVGPSRREQVVGGLRDEHLAAVTCGADPGGPMDVEPEYPPSAGVGSPVWTPIRTRSGALDGQA